MTRPSRFLVVFAFVLAAGCGKLKIGNGQLRCSVADAQCPDGYHCASDRACWKNGQDPTGDGGTGGRTCAFDVTSFDSCVMQ